MNGIRLFFKSAKGSVFSSLTLFVVLGAVLLTLNYTLSQYLYIRRAGEMFENAGLSGYKYRIEPSSTYCGFLRQVIRQVVLADLR